MIFHLSTLPFGTKCVKTLYEATCTSATNIGKLLFYLWFNKAQSCAFTLGPATKKYPEGGINIILLALLPTPSEVGAGYSNACKHLKNAFYYTVHMWKFTHPCTFPSVQGHRTVAFSLFTAKCKTTNGERRTMNEMPLEWMNHRGSSSINLPRGEGAKKMKDKNELFSCPFIGPPLFIRGSMFLRGIHTVCWKQLARGTVKRESNSMPSVGWWSTTMWTLILIKFYDCSQTFTGFWEGSFT